MIHAVGAESKDLTVSVLGMKFVNINLHDARVPLVGGEINACLQKCKCLDIK